MGKKGWGFTGVACAGLAAALGVWMLRGGVAHQADEAEDLRPLRLATTNGSFIGWSAYVAEERGDFKSNGLAVAFQYGAFGRENLQAVREGEADAAISSETPFIRAVIEGADLCVLAILVTARDHVGVVAHGDAGIRTPEDLAGKRIGMAPASNGDYLLDLVLTLHGMDHGAVRRVWTPPERMIAALLNREVDAIVAWNPQKLAAIAALGENAVMFDAHGVYASYFILTTTKAFAAQHPETAQKLVQALVEASRFIQENPVPAVEILARRVPALKRRADMPLDAYDVRVRIDQTFLFTLEDQARWILEQGAPETGTMPNILDAICPDALEASAPDDMTLTR